MGVDEICREYFLWCRFLYGHLDSEEKPAGKTAYSGGSASVDAAAGRQQREGGAVRSEPRLPERRILSL